MCTCWLSVKDNIIHTFFCNISRLPYINLVLVSPAFFLHSWTLKMGLINFPERSVTNYCYSPQFSTTSRRKPEISHILFVVRQKWRIARLSPENQNLAYKWVTLNAQTGRFLVVTEQTDLLHFSTKRLTRRLVHLRDHACVLVTYFCAKLVQGSGVIATATFPI